MALSEVDKVIRYSSLFLLLLLALDSDLRRQRIPNSLNVFFMAFGLFLGTITAGWGGLLASLQGLIFPIVLLYLLFTLGVLGAGDIKLCSAIGALMGGDFVLSTLLYIWGWAGIWALFYLLCRQDYKERVLFLFNYLQSCCLSCSILPYTDFSREQKKASFPFTLAVFCGTVSKIAIACVSK